MPTRPCLTCGKLTRLSRCPAHTRAKPTYTEQQRRAGTVAAWRAVHGDWCPGWHRPPHPAADLTADHVTAVANGGCEDGRLQVLCRPCNSAKQDRSA